MKHISAINILAGLIILLAGEILICCGERG